MNTFFRLLGGVGSLACATLFSPVCAVAQKSAAVHREPTAEQKIQLHQFLVNAQQKIVTKVLANGFTIVVYPIATTQEVFLQLAYKVGAKDEEPQERGNAHFVEHLLFTGTKKMSEVDLEEIADKFCMGALGGKFNASTSYDETLYYFQSDKANWPVFVNILADCMKNARFGPDQVISELKRILEELKYRNLDGHLNAFGELLPKDHPYHISAAGFASQLVTRTSRDIREFYKKHYRPDKAALIVVGNVDVDDFVARATALFEGIKKPREKMPAIPPQQAFLKEREYFTKEITVYQSIPHPTIELTWILPGDRERNFIELGPLSQILQKRLSRILKDKKNLVLNIGVSFWQGELAGCFGIEFTPKADGEKACAEIGRQCRELITQELARIQTEGVTLAELEEYKAAHRKDFLNAFERPSAMVNYLTYGYRTANNPAAIFTEFERQQALKSEDVQQVAADYLRVGEMSVFTTIPHPEGYQERWEARQAELDEYNKKIGELRVRTSPLEKPKFLYSTGDPQLLASDFLQPDEIFTLSNGLKVYYKKRTSTPFVSFALGCQHPEKTDLFFASHAQSFALGAVISALANGSVGYSKHDHEDFFDKLDGDISFGNAVTGQAIAYQLETMLDRVFYMMQNPTFPEEYFAQWKENLIKELTFKKELPRDQMVHVASRYFTHDYPWSKSLDQLICEVSAYQRDDFIAHYVNFGQASNFYCVVVGNIDATALKAMLEKTAAQWNRAGRELPVVDEIPVLENQPASELAKTLPQERVKIFTARLSPKNRTQESLILKLLTTHLQKKFHELSQKDSLFYGGSAMPLYRATILRNGMTAFVTEASLTNTSIVVGRITALIEEVGLQGITLEILNKAKMAMLNDLAQLQDTNNDVVSGYSVIINEGLEWTYFADLSQKIREITVDEVNQFMQDYFTPQAWSTVTVGRVTEKLPERVTF